ncbi:MAG: cytochrome c [Cytophagales bacterium]|nr:cytochrome c [Cytophagales bacterium]
MKKKFNINSIILTICAVFTVIFVSCTKDYSKPGMEYAPEMYHSRAYEPLSQVTDKAHAEYNSNENNPYNMNMRVPVPKTVKIQKYNGLFGTKPKDPLLIYHISKDSFDLSGKVLKNPLDSNDKVLAEGQVLYTRYCQHCHGETGQGDGSVGKVYKGVPAYNKGRVKFDTEGHIFHTITFGRNRMWPHASQISVEDRWKIVMYVQTLQNLE